MNVLRNLWNRIDLRSGNLDPKRTFLVLFVLSFLVRLGGVVATTQYSDLRRYEMEKTAISLATTGIYGNEYILPTGPSAHVSPGYTLLLAAIFRLFGTGQNAEIIKQVLACVVTALEAAALPLLARALLIDIRAGILAGLMVGLLPLKLMTETMGDWDTPWVALCLMLICGLTAYMWRQRRFSLRNGLLIGMVWGVSLLFGSALLTLLLVMLATGFVIGGKSRLREYGIFAAVQVLIVFLFLAPWAIRNKRALGSWIFTRSNLGIELRLSNNDFASPWELDNYSKGVYQRFHPFFNVDEARRVQQLGEVAYNRECLEVARQWIEAHPARFLNLTFHRFMLFWLIQYASIKAVYYAVTRGLGLLGAFYLLQKRRTGGLVLLLVLAAFPLPYYLVQFSVRYSFPIDWILMLTLSVLLVAMGDQLWPPRGPNVREQAIGRWSSPERRAAPPAPVS